MTDLSTQRIKKIRDILQKTFSPSVLEVLDESAEHIGHAGAKTGRGHFALTIASKDFQDKTAVQSHRMIYQALDALMQTDIHALKIHIVK